MDEIFGREGRLGSGTLASLISPNILPHETIQPPGAQPGEDTRNDSELTEPLSEALARDLQIMDVTGSPPEVASSRRRSEALLTSELLNMDANDEYRWASQDLPATSFAASSTGAHFDTTATLKLFELLRGVREQVQIALWDIHVAIPEVSPRQAQEILDKMIDELERRASW